MRKFKRFLAGAAALSWYWYGIDAVAILYHTDNGLALLVGAALVSAIGEAVVYVFDPHSA